MANILAHNVWHVKQSWLEEQNDAAFWMLSDIIVKINIWDFLQNYAGPLRFARMIFEL